MILIANRGNLFGRNPEHENSPFYLNDAIVQGYHVLIDTWWMEGGFWFGKDFPRWKAMGGGHEWMQHAMNSVWLRAKNPEALHHASEMGLNVFWHQSDSYALSTWGHLLGFYGAKSYGPSFVHVLPEQNDTWQGDTVSVDSLLTICEHEYAIVSDHVENITKALECTAETQTHLVI